MHIEKSIISIYWDSCSQDPYTTVFDPGFIILNKYPYIFTQLRIGVERKIALKNTREGGGLNAALPPFKASLIVSDVREEKV